MDRMVNGNSISFISRYEDKADYAVFDAPTKKEYRLRINDNGEHRCLHENINTDASILPRLIETLNQYRQVEHERFVAWKKKNNIPD